MTEPGNQPLRPKDGAGKWSDLAPRLISAAVLAAVAAITAWAGGMVFVCFVAICVGVTLWELARMQNSAAPVAIGAIGGGVYLIAPVLPAGWGLAVVLFPAIAAALAASRDRLIFICFTALITLAGYGLVHVRQDYGLVWLVWLILVVAASDVLGYFAGRLIGGPKFWPRISPKKTWSGTIAGWIAAGLMGAIFAGLTGTTVPLVLISVAMAVAAQFGDIAESALKRRAGIKDSSNLIPGHGGFFDRFDGVLGASVFLILVGLAVDLSALAH